MNSGSQELGLVGLNELPTIDRWALERRARAAVQPVYLGQSVSLCRVLARYKFFVDTTDVGFGANLLLDGFWETWLTTFIARRVRPGANAIDVGANHGYYTMLMADLAGADGRVAAVEPNPDICRLLRRTVAINGFSDRVVVLEMAAGDTDGQSLRLGLPAQESKNAYVFSPTGARPPEERSVAIRGDRLDTVLADWDRLDFVKIDVEGAEEAAVGGLFRLLERHLPMLVLEFNPARCSAPAALLDRLADLYGSIQHIDFDGEAHPTDRSALLDLSRREDWLLYFSTRPPRTP